MKIPMFGFNRYRLKTDGYHNKEVAYIKVMQKWKDQNNTIFDTIVFGTKGAMTPKEYLNDRELAIVASTLQWLGTPVGESYLREVKEMEELLEPFTKKD